MLKQLIAETGGRPLYNNDLLTLQDELSTAILAPYLALPWSCVLVGCDVSPTGGNLYNVGPGVVYFAGSIHRFDGAANVSLPAELHLLAEVKSSIRAYETGGSKACMAETKLGLTPVTGGGLLVTADGVLRIHKAQEAMFRSPAESQPLFDFPADYDSTGKGKYGTKAYGWALCNGNNGTTPAGGRFMVGYLAGDAEYGSTKKTGGLKEVALTSEHNGPHEHTLSNDGSHTHSVNTAQIVKSSDNGGTRYGLDPGNPQGPQRYTTETAGSHTHTMGSSGEGKPHENRPPYVVVAWRQWIGW